jgi:hypothetical protein
MVFSQSLNWDLTADVTGGPWKGTKIKRRPQKGVSVFQGHRRKRHLLEGLPGNFPKKLLLPCAQFLGFAGNNMDSFPVTSEDEKVKCMKHSTVISVKSNKIVYALGNADMDLRYKTDQWMMWCTVKNSRYIQNCSFTMCKGIELQGAYIFPSHMHMSYCKRMWGCYEICNF